MELVESMGDRCGTERSQNLLIRRVDGEVLILDTRADRIHQLNETASVVWSMAQHGATTEQIAESLSAMFDADRESIRRDVENTRHRLEELGLLRTDIATS